MPRSDERGGKRPGSGRKPGSVGTRPSHKLSSGTDVLDILDGIKLAEIKAMAVRLSCMGKRPTQVYKELGVSEATFFSWKREPWWKEAVAATLKDLIASPTTVFSDYLPKSLEAMEDSLSSDDIEARWRAAREVWDRLFGKSITRQQSDTALQVNITFKSHEQEPIEGEFREVESEDN